MNRLLCSLMIFVATAASANPMDVLNNECRQLTGHDYDLIDGCLCSDGKVFSLERRTFVSSCRSIRALPREFSAPWSKYFGVVLGADKVTDPDSIRPELVGSSAQLKFKSAEEVDAYFARIESLDGTIYSWHPHVDYFPESVAEFLYGHFLEDPFDAILEKIGLREDHLSQNIVTNIATEPGWHTTSYYSPDLDSLLYMTGQVNNPALLNDALVSQATAENPLHEIAVAAYRDFLSSRTNLKQGLQEHIQILRGDDCKGLCRMSAYVTRYEGYSAYFHQEILRGMPQKRFLIMTNDTGTSEIILQMTPNFYPSVLIVRNYKDGGLGESQLEETFYDKNGQKIFDHQTKLFSQSMLDFISSRKVNIDRTRPRMFSCEGDRGVAIDAAGQAQFMQNMVFGSEAIGFGWRKSSGKTLADLGGVMKSTFGTVGAAGESYGHIWQTTLAAMDAVPNVQVLPLGSEHCVEDLDSWLPHATTNDVKVISIPRKLFYEKNSVACEQQLQNKVRSAKGKKILWVISAGNEHAENPTGDYCLSSKIEDNVITVAASTGANSSVVASYSNYGSNHADLVANGEIRGNQGTSFAAPRVAAIAAKIASTYTTLSPQEIKQALLIGSEMSDGLKSKVRSSSWLNTSKSQVEADALKAAKCFESRSSNDKKECLGIRHCSFFSCSDNWPSDLKYLKDQGLLNL